MYSYKNLPHIFTILQSIEKINLYCEQFNSAEALFIAEYQLYFNASCNLLLAIGEESNKIESDLKDKFPLVNWKALSGFRNIIAHNYRGTDPDIVWDVIQNKLSDLKEICIKMIKCLDIEEDAFNAALSSDYYHLIHYLKDLK